MLRTSISAIAPPEVRALLVEPGVELDLGVARVRREVGRPADRPGAHHDLAALGRSAGRHRLLLNPGQDDAAAALHVGRALGRRGQARRIGEGDRTLLAPDARRRVDPEQPAPGRCGEHRLPSLLHHGHAHVESSDPRAARLTRALRRRPVVDREHAQHDLDLVAEGAQVETAPDSTLPRGVVAASRNASSSDGRTDASRLRIGSKRRLRLDPRLVVVLGALRLRLETASRARKPVEPWLEVRHDLRDELGLALHRDVHVAIGVGLGVDDVRRAFLGDDGDLGQAIAGAPARAGRRPACRSP